VELTVELRINSGDHVHAVWANFDAPHRPARDRDRRAEVGSRAAEFTRAAASAQRNPQRADHQQMLQGGIIQAIDKRTKVLFWI
jgi:hypothetical protein